MKKKLINNSDPSYSFTMLDDDFGIDFSVEDEDYSYVVEELTNNLNESEARQCFNVWYFAYRHLQPMVTYRQDMKGEFDEEKLLRFLLEAEDDTLVIKRKKDGSRIIVNTLDLGELFWRVYFPNKVRVITPKNLFILDKLKQYYENQSWGDPSDPDLISFKIADSLIGDRGSSKPMVGMIAEALVWIIGDAMSKVKKDTRVFIYDLLDNTLDVDSYERPIINPTDLYDTDDIIKSRWIGSAIQSFENQVKKEDSIFDLWVDLHIAKTEGYEDSNDVFDKFWKH